LKAQLHGNRQRTRQPTLAEGLSFDFELGDVKYNRSGNTVVQIIIPYEHREMNLHLQDAIGLLLHAEVTRAKVTDDVLHLEPGRE
jgi:hypothetical protein